jgi:hypothetical protein
MNEAGLSGHHMQRLVTPLLVRSEKRYLYTKILFPVNKNSCIAFFLHREQTDIGLSPKRPRKSGYS